MTSGLLEGDNNDILYTLTTLVSLFDKLITKYICCTVEVTVHILRFPSAKGEVLGKLFL